MSDLEPEPEPDGMTTEEETEFSSVNTDAAEDEDDNNKNGCCDQNVEDVEEEDEDYEEDWADEMTGDVIEIILQFLEISGLDLTYKTLCTECESVGCPVDIAHSQEPPLDNRNSSPSASSFNARDAHLLYKYFDTEQSEEMLRQWTKLLTSLHPTVQDEFRKITFFLRIFAAAIPFRRNESGDVKAEALTELRDFFQEKTEEFATDEKMLSLFALPFVQDPAAHPVFKEIFQDSWKSKLRAQICLSVHKFFDIQNLPTLRSCELVQMYLHERSSQRLRQQQDPPLAPPMSQTQAAIGPNSRFKYNRCTPTEGISASASIASGSASLSARTPTSPQMNLGDAAGETLEDPNNKITMLFRNRNRRTSNRETTVKTLHDNLKNVESTLLDVELRYHKLLKVTAEMVAALEAAVQGRDQNMEALQIRVTSVFPELFTAFQSANLSRNRSAGRQHPQHQHPVEGNYSGRDQDEGGVENEAVPFLSPSDFRDEPVPEPEPEELEPEENENHSNNADDYGSDFEENADQNNPNDEEDYCRRADERERERERVGAGSGSGSGSAPMSGRGSNSNFGGEIPSPKNGSFYHQHFPVPVPVPAVRVESEETITDVDMDLGTLGGDPDDPDFGEEFELGHGDGGGGGGSGDEYISPQQRYQSAVHTPTDNSSKAPANANAQNRKFSSSCRHTSVTSGPQRTHSVKAKTTNTKTKTIRVDEDEDRGDYERTREGSSYGHCQEDECHGKNLREGQGAVKVQVQNMGVSVLCSHSSRCQMPPVPPFNVANAKVKYKGDGGGGGGVGSNGPSGHQHYQHEGQGETHQSQGQGQGQGQHRHHEPLIQQRSTSKKRNYVKSMESNNGASKLTLTTVAPTPRGGGGGVSDVKFKLRPSASASSGPGQCQSAKAQQAHLKYSNDSSGQERRRWASSSVSVNSNLSQSQQQQVHGHNTDPNWPPDDQNDSARTATTGTGIGAVTSSCPRQGQPTVKPKPRH